MNEGTIVILAMNWELGRDFPKHVNMYVYITFFIKKHKKTNICDIGKNIKLNGTIVHGVFEVLL